MEQTTLYYRQGSSDKVYQASIEQQNGGYVVNFAFGRRGTTLQTGTKTNAPVSYDEAKRIFDKLVNEKTAKGYTPGEDGMPYQHTDKKSVWRASRASCSTRSTNRKRLVSLVTLLFACRKNWMVDGCLLRNETVR